MLISDIKVGRYYSLHNNDDIVIVLEISDRWIFFSYAFENLFCDRRNLDVNIFIKCYKPNKICDVLYGKNECL